MTKKEVALKLLIAIIKEQVVLKSFTEAEALTLLIDIINERIKRLPKNGNGFVVSDLFEPEEWDSLSPEEKALFGKWFEDQVNAGLINAKEAFIEDGTKLKSPDGQQVYYSLIDIEK